MLAFWPVAALKNDATPGNPAGTPVRNVPKTSTVPVPSGVLPVGEPPSAPATIPAGNLAGLPAVCVPNGIGAQGIPTSLQLLGRAFSEPALLVLSSLAGGPKHGYAITNSIQQRSADVLKVDEGALYPALHRLEDAGLVAIGQPPMPPRI